MKKQTANINMDEMELVVIYEFQDHRDMVSDDPPYFETWTEFEVISASFVLFGKSYDIIPLMTQKEIDKLAEHVSRNHPSLLSSLEKVMA
jgi:hypothetical protein